MEATKEFKRKRVSKKQKLSPEENSVKNSSIKPQNKYMEAFLKHQGSFIVYDPNFMLWHAMTEDMTLVSSDHRFPFYRRQGLKLLFNKR